MCAASGACASPTNVAAEMRHLASRHGEKRAEIPSAISAIASTKKGNKGISVALLHHYTECHCVVVSLSHIDNIDGGASRERREVHGGEDVAFQSPKKIGIETNLVIFDIESQIDER